MIDRVEDVLRIFLVIAMIIHAMNDDYIIRVGRIGSRIELAANNYGTNTPKLHRFIMTQLLLPTGSDDSDSFAVELSHDRLIYEMFHI